jgi:molybdopterin-binding protein
MPRRQRSYSATEAAAALGISVETLRRWDRTGRIRTKRDAANRFRGTVREIKVEGLLAQVELEAGPFRVVSIVTREAVEELGLQPGAPATAIVKATSVMLER